MTDTPEHIKDLQLKLWLSKSPGERLYQFIMDNDAMYQALREFKIKKVFHQATLILWVNISVKRKRRPAKSNNSIHFIFS